MPFSIQKIENKPIFIVSSDGTVTPEERASGLAELNQLIEGIEGTIYRIIDVRQHNMDFPTFVVFLKGALTKEKGSIGDPRFYNVFVGREKMTMMLRDSMQKRAEDGNPIPLFWTIEDALHHIEEHMAQQSG